MNKELSELILKDREERQKKIQSYLKEYDCMSLKANYPTQDKNNYLAHLLIKIFEKDLDKFEYVKKEILDGYDGRTILYLFDRGDAEELKENAMMVEEDDYNGVSLGRFVDIDIYSNDSYLSRKSPRKCYLCDKEAVVCMRENNHTSEELINFIKTKTFEYLEKELKRYLEFAFMLELNLDPKFGLVSNRYHHKDMDNRLMRKAQNVIIYNFINCYDLGLNSNNILELREDLKNEGLRAEFQMLKATKGINCYKGLIYGLGLFLGGLGYYLTHQDKSFEVTLIDLCKDELNGFDEKNKTFGYEAYQKYGISGARGVAKSGFKVVFDNVNILNNGFTDDNLYQLLINIVSSIDDTVLLKRSKTIEDYKKNKEMIKNINYSDKEKIKEISNYFEQNDLSIGGSCDLFIITIVYSLLSKNINLK